MKNLILLITLLLCISCNSGANNTANTKPIQKVTKEHVRIESSTFKKGKRQLEIQGYKNIKETNYPWFCCAEEDSLLCSTGFEATDADGQKVSGCMCVKDCIIRNSVTIRFE